MDWADEQGGAPAGREARGDDRPNRRAREERLDTWMSRGRELVDGVSGTRPGSRASGRGGGGRLDGLGRWVEGKLDWLLDDREDWQEPWQEAERPAPLRGEGSASGNGSRNRGGGAGGGGGGRDARIGVGGARARGGIDGGQAWDEGGERRRQRGEPSAAAAPPAGRSRAPLEAISRRGAAPLAPARQTIPAPPPRPAQPPLSSRSVPPLQPEGPAAMAGPQPDEPADASPRNQGSLDWPEEDTFTIPRWRRAEPLPLRPADPLAAAAPPEPPPGRPLPRSTRRR